MNIERIRQSLEDLGSPEAAPRLNAQVRLREEHVEMLRFLLAELDRVNLPQRQLGEEMRSQLAGLADRLPRREQRVYFMEACTANLIKIGISQDPKQRVREVSRGSANVAGMQVGPVVLLGSIPGGREKEKVLHRRFQHLNAGGEWYWDVSELRDEMKRLIEEEGQRGR